MNDDKFEMEEFLQLPGCSVEYLIDGDDVVDQSDNIERIDLQSGFSWSDGITRKLLELYKLNHKKVGHCITSFKKLYELLCNMLNSQFGLNLKPSQVEHKMRNLIKAYKALVDNNNKTGRGKKYFKFESELTEIFAKCKKIHPEILLTESREIRSEPIKELDTVRKRPASCSEWENTPKTFKTTDEERSLKTNSETPSTISRKASRNSDSSKMALLLALREDKKKFHEKQLSILQQDADERKQIRLLMAERNSLLKTLVESLKPVNKE
ncbi:hypothetical protein GE061_009060 [Apolygus lucorum]|uniref:Myb/SANT-like DNA-binding domain-containing protein n=1 Tax=Apolygus lucorum TaxID=248454 RepID=A0A8S9XZ46_APOLU|nr:hypothetical protein GE061_009060 [Apolygus lucorum]